MEKDPVPPQQVPATQDTLGAGASTTMAPPAFNPTASTGTTTATATPAAAPATAAPTNNVDQAARDAALAKAGEYVTANPGKTYGFADPISPPGGKIDCSGLVRAAIIAAGYKDPFLDPNIEKAKFNPGMPKEDGTGMWQNGVAVLVSNPNWQSKPLTSIIPGDVVTFSTTRRDHQGEGGKYDHVGIVKEVTKGADGNVTSFTFIHSATSNGPTIGTYDLAKPPSWMTAQSAYSWDNPAQ